MAESSFELLSPLDAQLWYWDTPATPMNMGNLLRSAHAFGAKFFFTIGAHRRAFEAKSDTSKATFHLPVYHWASAEEMVLPLHCKLVGVELIDGATDLPSFRYPLHAAYVLGPELGVLSDTFLSRCDHVVKIPTAFCINVAMAGAIVMYDRVRSLGSFPDRLEGADPVLAGIVRSGKLPPAG